MNKNPPKFENAFTKRKRKRKNALIELIRVFRTKTCFPSEKHVYLAKNAITERKRHTQMRKRFNRAKSSTANAKTRFPSGNVAQ